MGVVQVLRLREEEQISGKQKMMGGCRSLVILFAILGIVQASCGESEECVPLRFCSPLKEGVVKLNRDKFCGPAGFLRYCCPSQVETDSSKNKPLLKTSRIKELETENQVVLNFVALSASTTTVASRRLLYRKVLDMKLETKLSSRRFNACR